jgi:hypothetical protein
VLTISWPTPLAVQCETSEKAWSPSRALLASRALKSNRSPRLKSADEVDRQVVVVEGSRVEGVDVVAPPPIRMSKPAPPFSRSLPAPPSRMSLPPAPNRLSARLAAQQVEGVVALDDVGRAVARAQGRVAGQSQVLQVGGEAVADRAPDGVGPAAGQLGHRVAPVVDHIAVVAGPAGHPVDAQAAVEDVIAQAAVQDVGAVAAFQRVVAGVAGQGVGRGVADQPVRAAAADAVLDRRAIGDADIVGQPADHRDWPPAAAMLEL